MRSYHRQHFRGSGALSDSCSRDGGAPSCQAILAEAACRGSKYEAANRGSRALSCHVMPVAEAAGHRQHMMHAARSLHAVYHPSLQYA
eukprot:533772-Pelagomonas_calceolata.AAC.10